VFLFVHLYEPHKPWRAPDRFADLDPYDGEVAFADELTGRVVAELKSRGWYDAATVIAIADHGEGLGDHIEEEHGLFLYDEVVRVPWVMKLPHHERRGERVRQPVQHIDLLPTLASIYGLRGVPGGLRGRDRRRCCGAMAPCRRRGSTPRRCIRAITSAGASCSR
jgi:arylsulfatase A-like enzyme